MDLRRRRGRRKAAGRKFRLDALLFGESQGRIILAVKPEYARALPKAAEAAGVPVVLLGEGQGEAILKVVAPAPAGEGSLTITWPVGKLREAWTDAIPKAMARLIPFNHERPNPASLRRGAHPPAASRSAITRRNTRRRSTASTSFSC